MKRVLIALAAIVALLGFAVAPAGASEDAAPADITGVKFWSAGNVPTPPGVCVDGSAINGPYYKVAELAQAWNRAVDLPHVFGLNYEDDCAAAGYPPSRRFVVGIYSNALDNTCLSTTNTATTPRNGLYAWTAGPGAYMNTEHGCLSGQFRRDHAVSVAIGFLMGLRNMTTSGYSSRVMCSCTRDTISRPDPYSAQRLRELYSGYYGG